MRSKNEAGHALAYVTGYVGLVRPVRPVDYKMLKPARLKVRNIFLKRRLRKKLHLAEFQELGFYINYKLPADFSTEEHEEHFCAFIDFIESINLSCGGGGAEIVRYFVIHTPRGSVSPEQRSAVEAWLSGRKEVGALEVGPLVDAWYGEPE